MSAEKPVRILRLPEVSSRTGKKRSAIYDGMKNGTFPRSISLGTQRSVGWIESEIEAWIAERITENRQK